ncbi:MAG: LysR family transcriptional regulator [Pseudomonadaceae bacterium]|jgi:DNA-binding transcriptional LysR family regulator|uniref:LysR family transcriptional regulator n=2 Tax=Pseudomonas TaxID=286 RepID=UPI00069EF7DA|nr:LysR family transcriptional regulator [Pseudomonas sp.]MBQ53553.1 LysR family transcriptional regulator [Pseudomonadaceae bacterium]POF86391.1 transcriptional regulator [Pseudomonas putida]
MDWEDLRFFLSVATTGSLTGAARALNVNQATVSRRLAALEAQLNVRLVDRLTRESRLTAIGQQILQDVLDIEAKAFAIERKCSSSKAAVRSKVTITAPPILARHFLTPNLVTLTTMSPMVQLSILSEPHFASLSRMEADLALRLSPPIEDTDIVKKVGLMQFSLYAKNDYPYALDEERWEFVGYTERQGDFAHKRWLYEIIGSKRVACEVTDLSHQYEAACTGIGVAGLPCFIGDRDDRLIKLENNLPMLNLDIWIAMHPDRRNDTVVRKTADAIFQLLEPFGLGLASNSR